MPGCVASFAEAWIEINLLDKESFNLSSPPSRRRGLKYNFDRDKSGGIPVASFAEAWIEIKENDEDADYPSTSRLLRGGVD